jgi:hypothetical protein
MNRGYVTALETRLRWLKWAISGVETSHAARRRLPAYLHTLGDGETFVMTKQFCELVDYGRQTVPDDLAFESTWLTQPCGWMWLESPFRVSPPNPQSNLPSLQRERMEEVSQRLRICAVGWYRVADDAPDGALSDALRCGLLRSPRPRGTQFCCFCDLSEFAPGHPGFGSFSMFGLRDGDTVLDSIHQLESDQNSRSKDDDRIYPQDRDTDMLHEIRWVYTAIHLLSQKLATTVKHDADRATRRRLERERQSTPKTPAPTVRVVTLRRLEQARSTGPRSHKMDWQWQWRVRGFWREQWYAVERVHKKIWIEDFIKGPSDKPLKPPVHTIYVARR